MNTGRTNRTEDWGHEDSPPTLPRAYSAWVFGVLICLVPIASPLFVRAEALAEEEEEKLAVDPGFVMADSSFDQWIFGDQTPDHGLKRIESLLTTNVDSLKRVCGLTADQAAKLELAGRGDIKRFYDEVDVLHTKFNKVRRNRNAVTAFYQEILPVKAKLDAGLFDQTSLFGKVLSRSLSDEQSARYEEAERERREFRYHAKLRLLVAMMERTVPLRADQRERFVRMLKEETQPPKVFGKYDYYALLYQLSRIPDWKLETIFDGAEWKVVSEFKAQGQAMQVFLQQQNLLP